jgi:hypothetical protein
MKSICILIFTILTTSLFAQTKEKAKLDSAFTTKGEIVTGRLTYFPNDNLFRLATDTKGNVALSGDVYKRLIWYKPEGDDSQRLEYHSLNFENPETEEKIKGFFKYEAGSTRGLKLYSATMVVSNATESVAVKEAIYYLFDSKDNFLTTNQDDYRKTLSQALSSCPSVVRNLKNKSYKKNDFAQIVEDYNQFMEFAKNI